MAVKCGTNAISLIRIMSALNAEKLSSPFKLPPRTHAHIVTRVTCVLSAGGRGVDEVEVGVEGGDPEDNSASPLEQETEITTD